MKEKTNELAVISSSGLICTQRKIQIFYVNASSVEPLKPEGIEIKEIETLRYLACTNDKNGGTEADVKAMIDKARGAFIQLKNIWSSKVLSLHKHIPLYVLLYGTKIWSTTNTTTKKYRPLLITV